LHPKLLTLYNAGIYTTNKDLSKIKLFCIRYNNSIKNSDLLAIFPNRPHLSKIQQFLSKKYKLKNVLSRVLEPFYMILDGVKPWTHYLYGKKVLIINPFTESFKKQLENGFQMFNDKNKKIFLDNQEFVFYKCFQTIAGNHIHKDWLETFKIICNDIKKLDFDIALLGCGGYGLPLCNFIKSKLNKSAIYIGGGLQLLFGVSGKRWKNHKIINNIIQNSKSKFINPSPEERCNNLKTIENGCYW
jgi:hypothetical protein